MKIEKTKTPEEIVDRYTVTGVPASSLERMCKEIGVEKTDLMKDLMGQTCGLVGGEPLIYPWDIKRFLRGDHSMWD